MGNEKKPPVLSQAKALACACLTTICGLCFIIGGILVLCLFRDMVDNIIKGEIPLRQGSQVTRAWLNPPVRPLLRIYFFNTTNPGGFLKGEKPVLQEMGPYTWEEQWEKVGVSWEKEGQTVKYSLKKTYRFRRDLSVGDESDVVTVPNIPMFASVNQMRYAGKLVHQALSSMLEILKQEVFNRTTVGDLIWGYDHPLIKLGNDVLPPDKKLPFTKFGFFVDKNNSLEGEYEAMTGINNVHDIGSLVSYQGKTDMTFWDSAECNRIMGTDGTIFHPDVMKNDSLHIFNMNLCQSLQLVFQEEAIHQGITTYRFVPPSNLFGTPAENPKNRCYCKGGDCAPSGLFNVSTCQFGSPIMLSWPHFFQADPRLLEDVQGLSPHQDRHQFQVDILPKMGIAMRAAVRSQLNLVMNAAEHVKQLKGVRDIVYPILWFQDGVDELTDEETVSLLHLAVDTPEVARSVMYPVFFAVGALLLLAVLIFIIQRSRILGQSGDEKDIPLPACGRTPPPDYDNAA